MFRIFNDMPFERMEYGRSSGLKILRNVFRTVSFRCLQKQFPVSEPEVAFSNPDGD